MLRERCSLPQPAVFEHRKHGYASPRVIGDQRVLVGSIQSDVRRIFIVRGDHVQEREFPGLGLDGKCAHCARGLAVIVGSFVDCIQESSAGIAPREKMVQGIRRQDRADSACRWRNRNGRHRFLCCRDRCRCQRKADIFAARVSLRARTHRWLARSGEVRSGAKFVEGIAIVLS